MDYRHIHLTAAFRIDKRIKAYAKRKGVSTPKHKKVIYVPDAEAWIVHPQTVVDIVGGKPVQYDADAPMVVRDDTERVTEIAAYAMAWYGKPRQSVNVEIRRVEPFVKLGAMLRAVIQSGTTTQANTIVSSIEYDFLAPGGLTRIRTHLTEFDYPEA